MRILIDIGHPGHVHLFRPFTIEMQNKGHDILFTCRQKEFEIELLQASKFNYISFGKHYKTKYGKIWGLIKFNFKLLLSARRFKPDLFLSAGSMYAAQVSFVLRKPHIIMEDTGNMEQIRFYLPFTDVVLSPFELPQDLGKKQFRYHSFHELAYLNPEHFTPDKIIYKNLGIEENEKYAILRFVSWNATHDVGQGGFTSSEKDEVVEYLSTKYKLFISSEAKLPKKHEKYLFKISPVKIHHAMAFAEIVVSEGATMASEAGVLGTPSIYVNSLHACNNEDQESYGLVYNFRSGKGVLKKVKELEKIENKKIEFQKRRAEFLSKKINLTSFLVWFVENYPESKYILKENIDYQNRFILTNGLHSKAI